MSNKITAFVHLTNLLPFDDINTHTISIFGKSYIIYEEKNLISGRVILDRSIFHITPNDTAAIYEWIWYVIQTIELWSNKNAICNRTV